MTWDMHWVLGSNSAGYLKQLILPWCHTRLLLVYFHPIFLYIIMCNLRCELEFHFSFSKWILNWDQIDYQCCSQRTCSSFKQLRGRNSIFKLQIFLMDSSQKYYTIFCLILCWHNGRESWFQIAALGSNVFHNSKPKLYATKCCTYYSSIPPLEKKIILCQRNMSQTSHHILT